MATVTVWGKTFPAEVVRTETHPRHGTVQMAEVDLQEHGVQTLAFRKGRLGWHEFPHSDAFYCGCARLHP